MQVAFNRRPFCFCKKSMVMILTLDNRLLAVASFVPLGARVADIGTDHAYLAIYLYGERGAKKVIATDKNEGPLAAARHTIKEAGLSEKIDARLGDGLIPIEAGEVDIVCISGMGGELIAAILERSPDVCAGLSRLVLQPMSDASYLRRWLYDSGYHIVDESLAEADGRIYEIAVAEHGIEPMPENALLELGPVLCKKRPQFFSRHADEILARKKRILFEMEKSERARESHKYKKIQKEIGEIMSCLNARL